MSISGKMSCGMTMTAEMPRNRMKAASRSLQSICKDMNFVIRFGRIGCGGGNHGCEGHFGKEVCCAAERATRSADTQRQERSAAAAEGADIVEGGCVGSR